MIKKVSRWGYGLDQPRIINEAIDEVRRLRQLLSKAEQRSREQERELLELRTILGVLRRFLVEQRVVDGRLLDTRVGDALAKLTWAPSQSVDVVSCSACGSTVPVRASVYTPDGDLCTPCYESQEPDGR